MTIDMPNSDTTCQSRRLDVSLLIDSEVVRRGVESLISHIPWVQIAPIPPQNGQYRDVAGNGDADHVVIAGFHEWPRLAEFGHQPADERPWVLLLGDETHVKNISLQRELPCDGVMLLSGLNASTLDAILHRVIAGELPMPAVLARSLLAVGRSRLHRSAGHAIALTAREQETLGLLAQGFSNKQIAKALGISSHGVKRLVGALLLKLGAPNRTTAVIIAMNEDLV